MTEASPATIRLGGRGWALSADSWLASILGRSAYRLRVSEEFDGNDLTRALRVIENPYFVDVKVPCVAVQRVGALEAAGFRVIDTALQFERADEDELPTPAVETDVRWASPEDGPAVGEIAAGMDNSRFHLDPDIADAVASSIKREWVLNFFSGTRGDRLIVCGEKPSGFLLLLSGSPWVIDLIAVEHSQRRRGAARNMVGFAAGVCGGALRVGTQASNVAAVRLYESMGFRLVAADQILHLHGGVV